MTRVLVVDNYDSFTYNLVQYLGELGCELDVVRNDVQTVDALLGRAPDRVVVSPGPCTPREAGMSIEMMRRAPEAGIPTLGVCLGHQSLAEAFGGTVIRHEPVHGKTTEISHDGEGLFAGLPDPLTVGRYHSLVVSETRSRSGRDRTRRRRADGDAPPRAPGPRRAVPSGVRPDSGREGNAPEFPRRVISPPAVPNEVLTVAIDALASGTDLSSDAAAAVLAEIMDGRASEIETAAVLIALRTKGETAAELAGLARTMRAFATPVRPVRDDLVDTAGTGGGQLTFNVSTTAALIAAGAGCAVAKHGNRSATSRSGSADVLEALGVRIDLEPEAIADCIDRVGFGFMFAPRHHAATRFVVPVRQQLAVRTVFNFLGPLTNPAGARRQVIGVSDPRYQGVVAEAAAQLGADRVLVVSSEDGLDELSISAPTRVVEAGGARVHGRAGGLRPRPRSDRRRARRLARGQRRRRAPRLRRRARPAARPRRAQRGRGDPGRRPRRRPRRGRRDRPGDARLRRRGRHPREARRRSGGTRMSILDEIVDRTCVDVARRRRDVPARPRSRPSSAAARRRVRSPRR